MRDNIENLKFRHYKWDCYQLKNLAKTFMATRYRYYNMQKRCKSDVRVLQVTQFMIISVLSPGQSLLKISPFVFI